MSKKKKQLNWLEMVPVYRENIGTHIYEDGLVSVLIPRFNRAWMAKFFLPKGKKNEVRMNLDQNGSAVWLQIDGKNTIQDIVNHLSDIAENEENYQDRVILFLQGLFNNNIIKIYTPDNE